MASVWYIGTSNVREVLGYRWSRENQWSIPRDSFTEGDILVLAQDAGFWTSAPDGPRVRSQIPGFQPGNPNPSDDPVARMLEILLEARALGLEIDADVIAAAASAAAAFGYRNEAEGFKTAAGNSATAAGTSATNAGNSATAANTAKTGAETAKTAAETARTAAQTARTGAETARTGAETAATTSGTKATEAEAARANAFLAQQAAEAARDSTVAGTILDNAVTTNKIADKAVTAAKIANSTITNLQVAYGSLQTDRLDTAGRLSIQKADNSAQLFEGSVADASMYMSTESNRSVVIPYFMNDIAFNDGRGGASRLYVNGVLTAADLSQVFTPTSAPFRMTTLTASDVVAIEVDLCRTFTYGTRIGYAMFEGWRAKNVKMEYYYGTAWTTVSNKTDLASGDNISGTVSIPSPGATKMRWTFSNFNNANDFRIGQLFAIAYNSDMGTAPFVDRSGGAIYGPVRIGADGSGTAKLRIGNNGTTSVEGAQFGSDVFLYRNGNAVLRTDAVMLASQFRSTQTVPAQAADLTRKDWVEYYLNLKADKTQIGAASGIAPLDATSKIAATYLPSYVDDVLEYVALGNFPATGETGKIYIATGTSKVYRWSGSAYAEIVASPGSTDAVTEGATNKYFTDARAVAALATALGLKANNAAPALTGNATVDGQAIVKTNDGRLSDDRNPINHSTDKLTSGTLPVVRGGTGLAAATAGSYVRGAGGAALELRTPAQVRSDIGAGTGSSDLAIGTTAVTAMRGDGIRYVTAWPTTFEEGVWYGLADS